MKRECVFVLTTLLAFAATPIVAQLGAPNSSGVSIGLVQLTVRNPEQHKKLWKLLGATVAHSGSLELLEFPGIYIVLARGETEAGSEGSTVNHFGFLVKNVDQVHATFAAMGLPTVQELKAPKRWVTMFPDKIKVEFTEDATLSVPVAGHHLHLSTTASNIEPLRSWYVKTFGGVPAIRRGFPSAVFNGGEVNIIEADSLEAPTKGRALDHIGFEVQGLAAFCRRLEAAGVKFEIPYREMPEIGLKMAFFADPAGTRIEVTEGLAAIRP